MARREGDAHWKWDVVPDGGVIDLGGHTLLDRDAIYVELDRKATTT